MAFAKEPQHHGGERPQNSLNDSDFPYHSKKQTGGSTVLSDPIGPARVPGERIEQRTKLRYEQPPAVATLLIRGGPDTIDKLRRHAERTARAWGLDGRPLFGISVFAVLDLSLDDLLRRRFTNFRTVYLPTVGTLANHQFELLPTGQRPHFTVRLHRADDPELDRLLAAFGAAQPNPQYARGMIWREEG